MATIHRHYFQVCTKGAVRAGASPDRLLDQAGLSILSLSEPGWRGDVRSMALLVRAIWKTMGDEAMGFTSQGIPTGSFAFAVELAREAETVVAGLDRAITFYNLVNRDIRTTLSYEDTRVRIGIEFLDPDLDPDHYFAEFWMITWHRLACWLASETVNLLEASFDYERPISYIEEFGYLFPCPQRFNAEGKSLVLDGRALAVPIRRSHHEVKSMLQLAPLEIMTIPASDHSLTRRVRTLLRHDNALPACRIATALDLSSEALRKQLRREGTTLLRQRIEVRRDAAIRALSQSNRSIEAIAEDLGYAESRSFTRAFGAWTGMSPSRYRRSQLVGTHLV